MKRILGIGALFALLAFTALPPAASAAVVCSPINTAPGTVWPPANTAQKCVDATTPAHAGTVRSTLETLGGTQFDYSQRLQSNSLVVNDFISIIITDASLAGGQATVSHTIVANESLYTLESALATQVNALANFSAVVSGKQLIITSLTGNATTYATSTHNPGNTGAATETVVLSVDANNNQVATFGGTTAKAIIWYSFNNHSDFTNSTPPNPPAHPGQGASVLGTTIFGAFTPFTVVFESDAPQGGEVNDVVAHVTAHETGHQLDRIYGGGATYYSSSADFATALTRDKAAITAAKPCAYSIQYQTGSTTLMAGAFSNAKDFNGDFICTGGSGTTLIATYAAMTNLEIIAAAFPSLKPADANFIGEIFPEHFAAQAGFDDNKTNSGTRFGDDEALRLFPCTAAHVNSVTKFGRAPTAAELALVTAGVVPDGAGPNFGPGVTVTSCTNATQHIVYTICFSQGGSLNSYPLDPNGVPANSHAWACGPTTTTIPTAAHIQTLYLAMSNANIPFVKQQMKLKNALFFFFRNRTEANFFYANTMPFRRDPAYQQSTAVGCGATVYSAKVGVIASSIYETCDYNGTSLANPSLDRSGLHEMGHGFAYSLSAGTTNTVPDRISGFVNILNEDINGQPGAISTLINVGLTPSNWSTYTQAQKNTYICGMFGTVVPSALEISRGAKAGAVCSGGTPVAAYLNSTPKQIAIDKRKVPPYFMADSKEIWPEEFVLYIIANTVPAPGASPSTYLPATEQVLGYNTAPSVNSLTPAPVLTCTARVVQTWMLTLAPPTNGQLNTAKCPTGLGPLQ